MKKLRNNNQGLSLIEVLVSIVVLSIIVVPVLHSFITAANANTKSRKMHRATTVAQSLMEGFKAGDLEDIALQFNYPAQGFYVVPASLFEAGTAEGQVRELRYDASTGQYTEVVRYESPLLAGVTDRKSLVTSSTYSEDMGGNSEFLGQGDGVYYFGLESLKQDLGEYDVLVKLDAAPYVDSPGATDSAHKYNSIGLVRLPVLDEEQDAICIQKDLYTENALSQCREGSEVLTLADLSRTITVKVETAPLGSGESRTKVTVIYEYANKNNPDLTYRKELTAFDSTDAGKELRAVYLYYYPMYPATAAQDHIVFNNEAGLPVDFYLLKQKRDAANAGIGQNVTSSTDEENYRMTLDILEPTSAMQTKLYTNLATNLASGGEVTTAMYQIKFNNGAITLGDDNRLITEEVSDRVFDLEINVYEKGAAAAGYPEESRLATLEGSRLR